LELRQLSEAQRAQLREIWEEQRRCSSSGESKEEEAHQLVRLSARISELQQQTKRIREHIRLVAFLQNVLPHKKDFSE
jgi:hypothetical protein